MLDGLEWSVDYSALVSADGQNANFVGTISIANPTDANLTSSYLEMVSSNQMCIRDRSAWTPNNTELEL